MDMKTFVVVISALDVDALTGLEDGALEGFFVSFTSGLDGSEVFLILGLVDSSWGITNGMEETLTIVGALVSFLTSGASVFLTYGASVFLTNGASVFLAIGAVDGFLVPSIFVGDGVFWIVGFLVPSTFVGSCDDTLKLGFSDGMKCLTVGPLVGFAVLAELSDRNLRV